MARGDVPDRFADKRRKAERRGHLAEALAVVALRLKGYRILARRHRTKLGEIDIVARKGDVIAFVEVKARAEDMAAIDAVSIPAQRRIRAASDLWIGRQAARGRDLTRFSYRYDIVAILPGRWPRHYRDAF